MPIQGTVPVGGSFAPTDAADSFGTHNDKWGVGGYRIVKTLTDRNNIPVNESNLLNLDDTLASGRRKLGMMVYVSDEDKFYVLTIPQATWNGYNEGQKVTALANNANFAEFSAGGSPLTTKGDLYTFSTLNARLPVGGNNQILAADSTEPTGLKWINVPATVTPSALTKTDDTNVTLTLGGTPSTSLLQAVSLTLGWTGTLADSRIASASNWNTAYGWGNHASVGYITTISGISAGGDLSGTYTNPTVAKIQGQPISELDPTNGQVLQWNGTSWTPGAIPTGGTGGGGVVYYLNFNTAGEVPLTNIPTTPNTPKELGLSGEATPTSYQSAHLSTGSYDFLASFVTDVGFPSAETIPAGIWDFNIFAESTSTNSANQVYFKVEIYQYDDTETLTLLGTSSAIYIYDPAEINQYVASIIVTQTTLLETDRIVVYLYGRSHQNNKHITFYFGGSYPSHVHTTLSSVSGTGFVTVTNGIFDPVASSTINVNKLTAGTANQVIRMPNSDGDPAWGAINLASSAAVTGTLAIGNGGTGFASYAIGDLLYADTTTSLAKLAGVAAGSVLISNGTNTAPSWSTGPTLRSIILNNASNANTITLNTGATSPSSYTLTLPIAAPGANQYLQFTSGGVASWVNGTVVGVTTVGTFSASAQTNGASISGSTITFGPASATVPGMVSTGTQIWAGAKTFNNDIIAGAATLNLFNTVAITLSIGGAATTFALGGTANTTLTATLFGNSTTSGQTKTINIGTSGQSGSITNINIGSAIGSATGTTTFSSTANTFAGATTFTTGIVSTTSVRNTLGTALNLRNLYNNSETRTYSGMTIVNGVGGYVELTLTAVTTLAAGTLVRLGNITGTNLGTTTDYYVYASTGGTTLRLAATYANALAGTAITTATGPYSGGNATLTLHASAGTGTTLNFITGTASTPTSFSGSAIDSVLTSYGTNSAQPVFDLVFRTSTGGNAAAERLRVNATGTVVTGTLSGPSGSTLTIGGGSTTLPSATIAGGSFLSFGTTTYPTIQDYLPAFTNVTNSFSLGTKISLYSSSGVSATIGISSATGVGIFSSVHNAPAMWFASNGSYLGSPYGPSTYHFHNFSASNGSLDFDGGHGFRKGYPFFRIYSSLSTLNSDTYNEVVLAVARSTAAKNYGSITNVVQNGANIDITFTIATAGVIPSQFEMVIFGKFGSGSVVTPSNFIGSGRAVSVTAPTTAVGDPVTVSIIGILPTGTYVSGANLMGNSNVSSARISFETGAIFSSTNTNTQPFYPVTPALSYEIGDAAGAFSSRTGWHLFSHTGVTATIHMCSYSPTINFATLQTSASTINIGTANHTTTVNGNITLAGSGRTLGFFGLSGSSRASAYTQTYSAVSTPNTAKTHSAKTAAALTDSTGGTVSTTLAAIAAGTLYTQADMLAVKNALASLADQVNKLRNDNLVVANLVNSIIDDLQAYGLFQ